NEALQTCRDDGELSVPTDKPLIPLPSPPSSSNTGTHLHRVLATFMQLSPASQVKASAAVDSLGLMNSTPRPDTSSVSKVLFDTSKELPASEAFNSTYNLGIHHLVIELVEACQYLPLTLFTNKNNKCLHSEAYTLKCIKVPTSVGTNTHLLNLSQFKSEDTLDPLSWQEAWGCYLTWIVDVTPHDAHTQWSRHFLALSKDEGLRDCFKAILHFDIETCRNYILKPCQHDEEQWKHCLTKIKYEVLQEEVRLCLADRLQTSCPHFETQDKDSCRGVKRPRDNNLVTVSPTALKRQHQKERHRLQSTQVDNFANALAETPFASLSISPIPDVNASPITPPSTSAPSVETPPMPPSPASASESEDEDYFVLWTHPYHTDPSPPPCHIYLDHLSLILSPYDDDTEYSRIHTPYCPEGFDTLLHQTSLVDKFPELTFKL
ncbi:hypothetical protein PAXRUDRAFT_834100, partial [Paxillus rubicundulus Ve08.2h10]